jgi:Cys-tRNA synthase (O-phospho-L-seryl-tRNA:Cys-tRNA synthase)
MAGLWDMMDMAIAQELGVDVETYITIIDNKCTDEEAQFIIMTILDEDQGNLEKAKETFNKYSNESTLQSRS